MPNWLRKCGATMPTTAYPATFDELAGTPTRSRGSGRNGCRVGAADSHGSVPRSPKAAPSTGTSDRPSLHRRERSSPVKNRKREICTSGSVSDCLCRQAFFHGPKLPHCSPRGWPATLSSPALGRPYQSKGDRAAAPRGWLRDRPDRALPGRAITYDRVEDRQQLAGDRDDGDFLRLAGCYEAIKEGLEDRVVPPGHDGAHEQGCAHARPAAANEALTAPLPRLTGERREADECCDLLAAEGPKLRQLGNERTRNYRPDARHRGEQVLFLAPGRRATHGTVNIRLNARELTLQRLHEPADALFDTRISQLLTLPFGADHLNDLTPAGDKIGELLGCLIGQRPWCDAGRLAKMGNYAGIDRVRLGALADSSGEGPDLCGVADRDRQAGRREGRNDDGLKAAGGLNHDDVRLQHLDAGDELVQSGASAGNSELLTTWTHGNIEVVL